jgi:hypothetical protein
MAELVFFDTQKCREEAPSRHFCVFYGSFRLRAWANSSFHLAFHLTAWTGCFISPQRAQGYIICKTTTSLRFKWMLYFWLMQRGNNSYRQFHGLTT